jgi:hypothetical protein
LSPSQVLSRQTREGVLAVSIEINGKMTISNVLVALLGDLSCLNRTVPHHDFVIDSPLKIRV